MVIDFEHPKQATVERDTADDIVCGKIKLSALLCKSTGMTATAGVLKKRIEYVCLGRIEIE